MEKKVTEFVCTIIAATLFILSIFGPAVMREMFGTRYAALFSVAIVGATAALLLIMEVRNRKRKARRRLKRKTSDIDKLNAA